MVTDPIIQVSDMTPEQQRELNVCPRCGSFGEALCFDLRFKPQPHLTPMPTKRPHRERPSAGRVRSWAGMANL